MTHCSCLLGLYALGMSGDQCRKLVLLFSFYFAYYQLVLLHSLSQVRLRINKRCLSSSINTMPCAHTQLLVCTFQQLFFPVCPQRMDMLPHKVHVPWPFPTASPHLLSSLFTLKASCIAAIPFLTPAGPGISFLFSLQ